MHWNIPELLVFFVWYFPILRYYFLNCLSCSAIARKKWVLEKSTNYWQKSAISYQRILRKYVKAKLDIEFLNKCKSIDVYSKLVRWKNIKNKTKKEMNKFYKANLNDATKVRHNDFRKLQQQHVDSQNQLHQSTTWLKYHSILYSINRL